MSTILLLFSSNVFMTFAWYGHLKYGHAWPLWKAILVSWAIALLEYCLASLESDPGLVGDCAVGILPGCAGKSRRLWSFLGIPAQDHSRGRHARRFHRFRGHVLEGETRVELSRGVRLPWLGRVLRLC